MTPQAMLILGTIKAVAEAIAEGFRWAQTPEGQAAAKQLAADRAGWDKAWKDAWGGLADLFQGKLWEGSSK